MNVFVVVRSATVENYDEFHDEEIVSVHASLEGAKATHPPDTDHWELSDDGVWFAHGKKTWWEYYISEHALLP